MEVPVPGQLVIVRQRQFVVVDVNQGLPMAELRASDPVLGNKLVPTTGEVQHKVTLSSVEDDALGEELQVIWELEPGTRVLEKNSLPDPVGFDPPARLDTYLNAVRWGAVSNAEVRTLQAPFRSGIDIETYQLDPVIRAIQMPRVNLLIADDVGLGKTIEAGLVAQELIIRHRARTVLIICPPSLQIQWHDQMRDKFGLEFRIVDAELQKDLRRNRGLRINPWSHFPRLITSIDFIKRERPLRLLKQLLPAKGESPYPRRFDLLILDEAHTVAPASQSHYIADSLRTKTLRLLVPHFEHKLFLSATPHNGYEECFKALLELLDDQRFSRGIPLNHQQLDRVMVRRLKESLREFDDAPSFPKREIQALTVEYTAEERTIHQKLANYVKLRLARGVNTAQERFANQFVLTLLKKRLFSSPAAFYQTLAKHLESLETRTDLLSFPTNAQTLHNRLEEIAEEADFDAGDYDAGESEFAYDLQLNDALSAALDEAARVTSPPQADEETLLQEMFTWARQAEKRPDSKVRVLFQEIKKLVKPEGTWGTKRVIIFTEYRTTQRWLQDMLVSEGLADGEHLRLLYGGMPDDLREATKAAFQADPLLSPVRILLATDAASEGIDLQNYCSHLIHYEIPWNPNRLEQRNGRIDRHGQKAKQVDIFHFVGSRYVESRYRDLSQEQEISIDKVGTLDGDLEFLWHALKKVENIRLDLGTVGSVIAEQVVEAMLRRKKTLNTRRAENEAELIRKHIRFEKDMRKEAAKLREKLDESIRTLHLEPQNVQAVVETALAVANQPSLQPMLQYDAQRQNPVEAFVVPQLSGGWRNATRGLQHPHTRQQRPVVFDPQKAKGRDDVVLAHLNHTLVSLSLTLLRAATWRQDVQKNLHRVTARVVPARFLSQVAVVAYARLVILGGDSQRLHEEIIQAGGTLQAGRFTRMKKDDLDRALDYATTRAVPPEWQVRLAADWTQHGHKERLMHELEHVQNRRVEKLEQTLTEHQEYETRIITNVLQELQRRIEEHFAGVYQLNLWDDNELQQWKRDQEALRVRAESITDEIAQEQRLIASRYSERKVYLFPVAVTFLVPEHVL